MLDKIFPRPPRLEHPDPSQRIQAIEELPGDSADLERMLGSDSSSAVRAAAARRIVNADPLRAALARETDPSVRAALLDALGALEIDEPLRSALHSDALSDDERTGFARRTPSAAARQAAVAAVRNEDALVELALGAELAETRIAAAERVQSKALLQKLADQARNKDNGVARSARQRLDALKTREAQGAEADAILTQLEALAEEPGPILTAVVELNRRWQALDLTGDTARLARCDAARQVIQDRFDREQEEQRTKAAFERRVREWLDQLPSAMPDAAAIESARTTLSDLREEAGRIGDPKSIARLDEAEQRIGGWERDHAALADAEALVIEAEKLAADTSIDNADLPTRWQALDRATRTPDLTRRFEAALMTVEQRRLAQIQATQQEANAIRLKLHTLLHAAEQALAAGQLKEARAATEEIRTIKPNAGVLPKPTVQRLSRAIQQLVDLEKWESFGQQSARVQLAERAEALAAAATTDYATLAQEVQKLRNEWKALDQQHAGVPKPLWERFDRACERAYAPAGKHFAELAQQRKNARKRREEFIAAAAAHAPTLVGENPDLKAIERWLRETDHAWHEGDLGSVDPPTWKKLDARMKEAIAPARDVLSRARDTAKAARQALIDEVRALAAKATERDAPAKVKAIQARWQEHARSTTLAQRDERALWEQFRSACDAVFEARQAKRQEEEGKKSEHRRALEAVCAQLEGAASSSASDADLKRALRDAQDQWKKLTATFDPAVRDVEPRFRRARSSVEAAIAGRAKSRAAASWQTLAAKERLCEDLDRAVVGGAEANAAQAAMNEVQERWAELPDLPAAQDKRISARRDAATAALTEAARAAPYADEIAKRASARRELLLELELLLGLDSPKELQQQRLALQVRQLKDRFKTATTASAPDRLLDWSATPGVCDATDRARAERIFHAVARS